MIATSGRKTVLPAAARLALVLAAVGTCNAQHLPPPSRTAYKCAVNGKVSYSDAPCEGAERLQLEPTRGLSKSTGQELIGQDVRRERFNEQLYGAVKPVTGKTPQEMAVLERRLPLSTEAQQRCQWLDQTLPQWEARERSSIGQERKAIQKQLLELRQQQRSLRC
ncbi:hypothetical protein QRD43_01345 [Pelomonas sp. APW6]|uniref:DUF4124 domain-containing protein n=1 Tax=Roseateles subflavus TaxID=3053353 RepID=A0ABT7LG41_9BURK|nr:hypothetical protein [Pelomonas sp. APW6]MDL5030536.1 hypothetical protein [Pelomonas sp. APW6]